MSWPASIAVAILTALVGAVAAGYVANSAANWYRMSSFEGASGFFVVGMALVGLVAGLVIGIVASRMVAATAAPSFLKALGAAQGATIGLAALVGVVARLNADVGPSLNGDELLLAVEIRWPEGTALPPANGREWFVRLGSSEDRTMRASREGPLWREDARQEDGRWIVPGAVQIFTTRGDRLILVEPEGILDRGFEVPLRKRPNESDLQWSEWLPRAREGEPALPEGMRLRYRVVPSSQPIRVETFGPFDIALLANGFGVEQSPDGKKMWSAGGTFTIRHNGSPVVLEYQLEGEPAPRQIETMRAVAALQGARAGLVVSGDMQQNTGPCFLLADDGDRLRTEFIGICGDRIPAKPLTSDPAVFAAALEGKSPSGRLDRVTLAGAELFLIADQVVDARTMTVRRVASNDHADVIERIPPLDVAPDGASFVRLASGDGPESLALRVLSVDSSASYTVPIDRDRTRAYDMDLLDPTWVRHYFTWEHAGDGRYRLVERTGVTPLPYRGRLTMDYTGYREYRVTPARESLPEAMIAFLVESFQAERVPPSGEALAPQVTIAGVPVHVSYSERDRHVSVWMDRGRDAQLVSAIAERFDAALRTGRFDAHFGR